MDIKPNRGRPLQRLSKALFVGLGVVAILMAVGLGLFRLLVAQIPAYQTELKGWVAAELGLEVDFATLDARLGLGGPALTLRAATIGGEHRFLEAEQATITLDPWALVFERQIDIVRLTLDGVLLTVERDDQGAFRLGDIELAPGDGAILASIPKSVEVVIRDSELRYVDTLSREEWDFRDVDVAIESADQTYFATASINPPEDLAGRLDLRLELRLPTDERDATGWHLLADAEAIDLERLAALVPLDSVPAVEGRGAVEAEIDWTGGDFSGIRLDADFEELNLGQAEAVPYDRIRLLADWQRLDADHWRLALDDITVVRNGRAWEPRGSAEFSLETDDDGFRSVGLEADFIRLEDLETFVRAFPDTQLAEQWSLFVPAGDIMGLSFSLERRNASFNYDLVAAFDGVAVRQVGATPGFDGVSGRVEATEDSGTIEFRTDRFGLDWPAIFDGRVEGESITGAVVWRESRDAVNVLSASLGVGILDREARASFDLELPRDGSSPTLDLEAELAAVDLVDAKQYLPRPVMPASVVAWLDRAILGGTGHNIELTFAGPLASFPFDAGTGEFRVAADVENASLDYMSDWPLAESIDGWIEFRNAGFYAGASGQAVGNRTENFELSIPDMRDPMLTLSADTDGMLADVVRFLRGAPLISERLGPGFGRIDIQGGAGAIRAKLDLPLMNLAAFDLDARLTVVDGSLAVNGLRPTVTEINGEFTAERDSVSAEGVDGIFVGGPISVSLVRSDRSGYRAELVVDGETSVGSITDAFGLPRTDLIDGQALWRGRVMLPALDPLATMPSRIVVESNLAGVALKLPEPMAKAAREPANLSLDLRFLSGNRLEVNGNLGATRRFVLGFTVNNDVLRFTSGAIEFGGGEPRFPNQVGILVGGRIETLELDRWLALGTTAGIGRAGPLFLGADVDVARMHAFGQQLGSTSLRVERGGDDWRVDVDSEVIAGEIVVPRGDSGRRPVLANMSRLYLAAPEENDLASVDPASLPGLRLQAAELGFGSRRLGSVTAVVEPDPQGVLLTEFRSQTANFQSEITGSWLSGARGQRTTLEAQIRSTDVAATLAELGLDPTVEGETATVNAGVFWESAPTGAWLDHLNGNVSLSVETGALREIDPGAGRVVGLMSIAALPRRLLLDFRDVFEEGFAFDEIGGSFRLIDGNAYTNDLKFDGPAAEIGVVGRTGLRDRDYRQQVVVTAEPGNMLPTVGGLLGGAGVGAALLIFTRLFKEPLKGIGRASYCLSGSWEEPSVVPIDDDEPDEALRCAELPDEMRAAAGDE